METTGRNFTQAILTNLRKIMADKKLKQSTLAEYAGVSESQFSRVLSEGVQLSLSQLANIARNLHMREIDVITYPEVYVPLSDKEDEEGCEVVLQVKVGKSKRDQVLNLMFGENNIEILNK